MERPLGSGVSPVFLVNILHVFSKFLFCFLFGHFPTPKGQTKNFEKPHSIFRKKGLTNPTWGQHVAAGPWQCCMWGWGAETRGAWLGSPPPSHVLFPPASRLHRASVHAAWRHAQPLGHGGLQGRT